MTKQFKRYYVYKNKDGKYIAYRQMFSSRLSEGDKLVAELNALNAKDAVQKYFQKIYFSS